MKKHVDFDHFTLLKRLLEDASIAPMSPIKKRYMYLHKQYLVFFNTFKKGDAT